METDIAEIIFNAIKQDDIELFTRYVEHNEDISFGRFPLLTLCYLYNSKKIIKKFEGTLIKQSKYSYMPENNEMYSKFKQVAHRSMRLYVGENKIVSPLEMLLILGEATKVEKLYKDAYKSNLIQENLKSIELIKQSQDIEIGETKIKLPKQPLKNASKKLISIVACIAIVMVLVSVASAVVFLHFGIGTPNNPYLVNNETQLIKALSTNGYIVLGDDITIDLMALASFSGSLDGAGHELTVQNVSEPMIKKLSGEIKNIKINMSVNIKTDVGIGLITNENNGDILNVDIQVSGKIKYTGTATSDSVLIGVIASKNAGNIKGTNLNLDLEVQGNGLSDVIFGGYVGRNESSIQDGELTGQLILNEVNGAGVCYENVTSVDNILSNIDIIQTSNQPGVSLLLGGISVLNTYCIASCTVSGKLSTENLTEFGAYTTVGGICAINYNVIDSCKFSGEINVNTSMTVVRTGGICSISRYYVQDTDPTISKCAAVGKINVTFTNSNAQGYIGGIIGEVSSYTFLEKSFSTMDIKTSTSEDILIICGLVGKWDGGDSFENNAYLKTDVAPHGISVYNIFFNNYQYYDSGDGMFRGYDTLDEIKALEIYW